jgi:hypothetical protein
VQLLACLIWRGFERRWNTDHLGHSDRIGFELAAHQDEPAKEHGAYDKKVDQNWHSHRCLPTKRDWENLGRICLTISKSSLLRPIRANAFREPRNIIYCLLG